MTYPAVPEPDVGSPASIRRFAVGIYQVILTAIGRAQNQDPLDAMATKRDLQAVNKTATSADTSAGAVLAALTTHESAAGTSVHGLGNSSTRNVGTAAGTVAAGNDARFGITAISAVCAETVAAGAPVYIDRVTGQFRNADASTGYMAFVAGLAGASVSSGLVATAEREKLELADWSAITGSASLSPGQQYFLGTTPGALTTTPPSVAGQSVAPVGEAVSATQMAISIGNPILL